MYTQEEELAILNDAYATGDQKVIDAAVNTVKISRDARLGRKLYGSGWWEYDAPRPVKRIHTWLGR